MSGRTALYLGLAVVCLLGALLWAPQPGREHPTPAPTVHPVPPPKPRPVAPPIASTPTPLPIPPQAPQPVVLKGKDWKALLASIAPEGYEWEHPGILEKLAALLGGESMSEEWVAGAVAYLAPKGKEELSFWKRAAEILSDNAPIADMLVQIGVRELGHKDPAALDALLAEQSKRIPKDPHTHWLRAGLAMKEGRREDALTRLKESSGLPWNDCSGAALAGRLQVQRALGENPDPIATIGEGVGCIGVSLNLLQKLSLAGKQARDLRLAGDPEASRVLLDQVLEASQGVSSGSSMILTHMVGLGMEQTLLMESLAQAEAEGNAPRADALRKRIEERRQLSLEVKEYTKVMTERLERRLAPIGQKLQILDPNPPEIHEFARSKERMDLLLTAEEKAVLERESQAWWREMEDFRAWQKENQK